MYTMDLSYYWVERVLPIFLIQYILIQIYVCKNFFLTVTCTFIILILPCTSLFWRAEVCNFDEDEFICIYLYFKVNVFVSYFPILETLCLLSGQKDSLHYI